MNNHIENNTTEKIESSKINSKGTSDSNSKEIKSKIINYIGIDVAKYKLDIFISTTGEYKTIENTEKAVIEFISYLKSLNKKDTRKIKKLENTEATAIVNEKNPNKKDNRKNDKINIDFNNINTLFIIDLTGGYETLCRDTFYNNNFKNIILAEGRKVKNYTRSLLHNKAKNDKIDSYILVNYTKTFLNDLNLYKPMNDNRKIISELYNRILDLKHLKQQEKNRYSAPTQNPKLKESIKNHIELLEDQIKELQEEIDNTIKSDKALEIISNSLQSEKGIKTEISQLLIATLPELGRVNRKQIASITGTAPISKDSGTIKGYRFTTGGRRIIKKYLFICILSQIRYNEVYKNKMEEMRSRGKSKMQCIVAIMRKYIVILNAKIRCELKKNNLL